MLLVIDAGNTNVVFAVFDGNMSAIQGTLGAVQKRLAVPEERWAQARRLLNEAGLGQWIAQ